jgi:hypothetical protein
MNACRVQAPPSIEHWSSPQDELLSLVPDGERGRHAGLVLQEPVSPELALVDPALAERERVQLAPPGWFRPAGARIELRPVAAPAAIRTEPSTAAATREEGAAAERPGHAPSASPCHWGGEHGKRHRELLRPLVRDTHDDAVAASELVSEPSRSPTPLPRPRRQTLISIATAALLVAGGGGLLWVAAEQTPPVGFEAPPGASKPRLVPAVSIPEPPATSPPPTTPTAPPPPAPKASPGTVKPKPVPSVAVPARPATPPPPHVAERPAPAASESRMFAWGPVDGASGYELELRRGSRRVLLTRTREPRVTVDGTWRHAGQTFRFEPGSYRWYVWPLRPDGTRGDATIVNARLVVRP